MTGVQTCALPISLLQATAAKLEPPSPQIEQRWYAAAFERVQSYIRAGDSYQANLTFPSTLPVPEDPRTLYVAIRGRAQAGHGGIVFTGAQWLLSFSPELFFTLESGRLTARPMKGTAARGIDRTSDEAAVTMLLEDPKHPAENLRLVDLLRNTLARARKTAVTG